MSNRPKSFLSNLRAALAGVILAVAALVLPGKATADITLPSPYVSRALDAVLLPINNDVKSAFALRADDTGVFVLSVSPGGVAESYGILPGDVISFVEGQQIYEPVDVDTWVYYWINAGYYDFIFDVWRGGDYYTYSSVITYDLYYEIIDIYAIGGWSYYSYDSFSYDTWYSEYSVEITESYESWESYIEESASSMTEEEMTNAELAREAAEEGVMTEEEMTNAELAREAEEEGAMTEEEMTNEELAREAEEEGSDEPAVLGDEGPADDEMTDDMSGEDEAVNDEMTDESGDDMSEDVGEEEFDDGGEEFDDSGDAEMDDGGDEGFDDGGDESFDDGGGDDGGDSGGDEGGDE